MTTASQLKEIIICFQSQKQLATLNNIQVLLKSVLIDLRARCVHARHRARNLASPELLSIFHEIYLPSHEFYYPGDPANYFRQVCICYV